MQANNPWGETSTHTPRQLGVALMLAAQWLLLVLRARHVITWSWYWVWLPAWLVPVLFLLTLTVLLSRKGLSTFVQHRRKLNQPNRVRR